MNPREEDVQVASDTNNNVMGASLNEEVDGDPLGEFVPNMDGDEDQNPVE